MNAPGKRKYAQYFPLIIKMYKTRNLSIEDIEKITGISDTTIMRMLKERGIPIKRQGAKKGVKRKK